MKKSPLARALRVDKLTLAALHWTLRALAAGRAHEIPVVAMLSATKTELETRAHALAGGGRPRGHARDGPFPRRWGRAAGARASRRGRAGGARRLGQRRGPRAPL